MDKSLEDIFFQIKRDIIESGKDVRYPPKAYLFVLSALDYYRTKNNCRGHISAETLVKGCAELALLKFGSFASMVLSKMNIHTSHDIGSIVYNLLEIKILISEEKDSLDDFFATSDIANFLKLEKPYSINKEKIKKLKDA